VHKSQFDKIDEGKQKFMRKVAILLLVLTSLTLGFLLMEVIVRVLDVPPRPMAPLPVASYQLSTNPVIRYEYIPGYRSDDGYFDTSHKGFEINSAGFRDYEYQQTKPDGTYRILVMGDSTTAGNGVAELSKTYTKILESELNATALTGTVFEVLNMGVGGYQTMQEIETLRTGGLAYDPDLVLVTVCINDFDPHADGGVYTRLNELEQNPTDNSKPTLLGSILRNSRLAFILYHRLRTNIGIEDEDRWYVETVLQGRSTVEAGFRLLSQLQRPHEFQIRVLVLPTFNVPFDKYDSIEYHDRVRDAATELPGITIVDLLEGFSSRGDAPTALSYDGLHLSEKGHEVMAELLLPVIKGIAAETGT